MQINKSSGFVPRVALGAVALCGAHGLAHAAPFTVASTPPNVQFLTAISAESATDVWGGGRAFAPLLPTVHFDGTHWTGFADAVVSKDRTDGSQIQGVTAISPTNAWAVGFEGLNGQFNGSFKGFIEHWDGTKWSLNNTVDFTKPGDGDAVLNAIAHTSASDIWAVGSFTQFNGAADEPLVMHFNGTSWTQVAAPAETFGFTTLSAVSARTPTDAWAVGFTNPDDGTGDEPITMHWDGTSWSFVTSALSTGVLGQDDLSGVVAVAANDVWAVGAITSPTDTAPSRTFIEHFDGTSWKWVSSPNLVVNGVTQGCALTSVTAVSATDIWAGGYCSDPMNTFPQVPLALHYNGTAWSIVSTPAPGPGPGFSDTDDLIFGATALPDGHVWFGGVNGTNGPSPAFSTGIVLQATGQ